jgi:hypothetical protein
VWGTRNEENQVGLLGIDGAPCVDSVMNSDSWAWGGSQPSPQD